MELTQWASMAEIVGSVAIVASLIFVGLQVDQNTRATRSDTHQDLLNALHVTQLLLVTDTDVLELVTKAETDPGSLTGQERTRFYEFVSVRMSVWEASYLNRLEGLMDDAHYAGYEGFFSETVKTPGYALFWKDNNHTFIEPFKSYVGSIIEKGKISDGG